MTFDPTKPRLIRITEKNWEGYTGPYGNVEFIDGLSVHPVPWNEQNRLAALIEVRSAEADENEEQLGVAAEETRSRDYTLEDRAVPVVEEPVEEVTLEYTRDQLIEIAETRGITGLREIATKMDITGRSINELVDRIEAKVRENQGLTVASDEVKED